MIANCEYCGFGEKDCGLILHANGEVSVIWPDGRDNPSEESCDMHVLRAAALMLALRDELRMNQLLEDLYTTLEKQRQWH